MATLILLVTPLVGDGVVVVVGDGGVVVGVGVVVVWTGLQKLVAQHEADTLPAPTIGMSEAAAQRFADAQPKKVPVLGPPDKVT